MPPWLICLLVLLGGGLLLAGIFYWTARRRDLVRRPVEKRVGYGAQRSAAHLPALQPGATTTPLPGPWPGPWPGRDIPSHSTTPLPVLNYDPQDYDLFIFGGSAYMGEVGRPLKDYLSSLHFRASRCSSSWWGTWSGRPSWRGCGCASPRGTASAPSRSGPVRKRSCASLPWDEPLHFPQGVSKIMSAGQGAPRSAQRAERSVDGPP